MPSIESAWTVELVPRSQPPTSSASQIATNGVANEKTDCDAGRVDMLFCDNPCCLESCKWRQQVVDDFLPRYRAHLLQELRRLSSRRRDRADVAVDLQRGKAMGKGDSREGCQSTDASLAPRFQIRAMGE